jgi:hypothetical protein
VRSSVHRTHRRRRTVVAVLLAVSVASASCTGDDAAEDPAPAPPSSSAEPEPEAAPDAALEVRVGHVAGELRPQRRRSVSRSVGRAVDRWFRAAWIAGPHPRERYGARAFPGFTDGAARSARGNKLLLTNQALAPRIDGVRVARRTVLVDLFSPAGRPAGATARFTLVLVTSGDLERRVRVTGRMTLVPGKQRWRILGYDVAREALPLDRPRDKSGKSDKSGDKSQRRQADRKERS